MKKLFALPLLFLLAAGCNASPTGSVNNPPPVGQNKQQERPVNAVTKKPIQETKKTEDETAEWRIYSHTKLGFSFKYPPSLKLEDEGCSKEYFRDTGKQWCGLHLNEGNLLRMSLGTNNPGRGGIIFDSNPSSGEIDVGGVRAQYGSGLLAGHMRELNAEWAFDVDFSHNQNSYSIIFWYPSNDNAKEQRVRQILSTFKFTK